MCVRIHAAVPSLRAAAPFFSSAIFMGDLHARIRSVTARAKRDDAVELGSSSFSSNQSAIIGSSVYNEIRRNFSPWFFSAGLRRLPRPRVDPAHSIGAAERAEFAVARQQCRGELWRTYEEKQTKRERREKDGGSEEEREEGGEGWREGGGMQRQTGDVDQKRER